MPNSNPRSSTDIALAAAATGKVVTRDSSGIALVTDTLVVPILHHRAQPITSGFDDDVALTVSSTRADGTDPGMDPGFPSPVGNIAFGIRNPSRENTPYRWPWMVADDGSQQMGQALTVSQMRAVNGRIIGLYGPGSVDCRPDGNWSAFRADNSMHDLVTPNPNAYCYGALDRDASDPRDADGPYSKASGRLKWAIGPAGEEWRGLWLVEDPDANRLSKTWLSTATGNLTFESSLTATGLTLDLQRPSTAGVGTTELTFGRYAGGAYDLGIKAFSSVTSDSSAIFTIATAGGLLPALELSSRNFASVPRPLVQVTNSLFVNSTDAVRTIVLGVIPGQETLPGMWLGIDPTLQSFGNYTLLQAGTTLLIGAPVGGAFSFKLANSEIAAISTLGTFSCHSGISANDTILSNLVTGGFVRLGWSGTPGEEPYTGLWFTSTPNLANFAVLAIGTAVIFNAPNTGTVQLRIQNGGGANFSQLTTDLDRAGVGITIAGHRITYDSAAPVSGTYVQGDIVYNIAPAAGGFIGWVCTSSGSPGTWKTWGVISA